MILLLSAFLLSQPAAQTPDVKAITLTPTVVAEIDLSKLKGKLVRELAWSPDGKQLYLQTFTEDRNALPKDLYHYVLDLGTPAGSLKLKDVKVPPEWATTYWNWKSAQAAPGDDDFKISLDTEHTIQSATAVPMGGSLAKGGTDGGATGASVDSMMSAAAQSQNATVYHMLLKGEVVGEFVNHAIMPGLTFGWGPSGSGLIAYAEKTSGRLVIMDKNGDKQKIDGTKNVVLPAWSADGTRLAYLESTGRTKYAVVIATVAR
jgi:WD40-like Beta Propeller Repeat